MRTAQHRGEIAFKGKKVEARIKGKAGWVQAGTRKKRKSSGRKQLFPPPEEAGVALVLKRVGSVSEDRGLVMRDNKRNS